MTPKEYLQQSFKLNRIIKAKEIRIQQLRDMQQNISATLSAIKVQTSLKPDPMAETIAELLDLIEEYQQDIMRLLDIEREIKEVINAVERDDYRLILTERYINLKRWEDIAADNNYSWQWVHKLHAKALIEIKQAIKSDTLDMV